MRTRVKICGITREEDARVAIDAGVDALGLVFYPSSPRFVDLHRARKIALAVPPFVTLVGLFVDAPNSSIRHVLDTLPISLLQFHGDETPAECEGYGRPWIKAIRMRDGVDLHAVRREYSEAAGLLLDAYRPGQKGGTGKVFDWKRIPTNMAGQIILAGGLTPDNVERAIQEVRPFGVDVSGGVERAKGIKDREKIEAFIRGVRRGDDSNFEHG